MNQYDFFIFMKYFFQVFILVVYLWMPAWSALFVVDSLNDSGTGSFRSAITSANANTGADTILFDSTLSGLTINLLSLLDTLTDDSTFINGDEDNDGFPDIEIKGGNGLSNGLIITSSNNIIQGLAINGCSTAISIEGPGAFDNIILSNFIGLDLSGTISDSLNNYGIVIRDTAMHNQIGDGSAIGINVVSGQILDGISIAFADSNRIFGNYIGLDPGGTSGLGNYNGIRVKNSNYTRIGDSLPGYGNVVSGNLNTGILVEFSKFSEIYGNYAGLNASGTDSVSNGLHGINLEASDSTIVGNGKANGRNIISGNQQSGLRISGIGVIVRGNFFGTDKSGLISLPNYDGLALDGANPVAHCVIGDTTPGGYNLISGNLNYGLNIYTGDFGVDSTIIEGNLIGTDSTGTLPLGNGSDGIFITAGGPTMISDTLRFNTIAFNKIQGIRMVFSGIQGFMLFANSIYKNDSLGIKHENGAQNGIVAPIVDSIVLDTIYGTSQPNAKIQLYEGEDEEGELFLDTIIADGGGLWSIYFPVIPGKVVTALQDSAGYTSEFSNAFYNQSLKVYNTNDKGPFSLRDAIILANSSPGPDTITFDSTLSGLTIYLQTDLDTLVDDSTVIDGDNDNDGYPDIEITGNAILLTGLAIMSNYNVIQGLVINGFNEALLITGSNANYNLIIGNFIGTDTSGILAADSLNMDGIVIVDTAMYNQIGDGSVNGANLISGQVGDGIIISYADSNIIIGNNIGSDKSVGASLGNNNGIAIVNSKFTLIGDTLPGYLNYISGNIANGLYLLLSDSNQILGNYIGVDSSGTLSIPNGDGIFLDRSHGNIIGNGTNAGRNLISGNLNSGILIDGERNLIMGNFIGTDVTGTDSIPNADGISLDGLSAMNYLNYNIIGDTLPGKFNVISGNSNYGIIQYGSDGPTGRVKIEGNFIGVDSTGTIPIPNGFDGIHLGINATGVQDDTIRYNIIAYNEESGIEIDGGLAKNNLIFDNSIFTNDSAGITLTNGAQNGMVPPVIDNIISDTVFGNSLPNARVQIYHDNDDEGEIFIDTVTADPGGLWSLYASLLPGYMVTALQDTGNNTSEFSTPFYNTSLIVYSLNDNGPFTLREAISLANNNPGADTITFDTSIIGLTIVIDSSVIITDDFTVLDGDIDGDKKPSITISGTYGVYDGIVIDTSTNNVIQYLNLIKFDGGATEAAITLKGVAGNYASQNTIIGNTIGTNQSGTDTVGGLHNNYGIKINSFSKLNVIGDTLPENKNIISGNTSAGIYMSSADSNKIYGNIIGLDSSGTVNLGGSQHGIYMVSSISNLIGDTIPGAGNILSGNGNSKTQLYLFSGSDSNKIFGNKIGTDISGTSVITGTTPGGIWISLSNGNLVGDGTALGANIIGGNNFAGINFEQSAANNIIHGNYIGVGLDSITPLQNTGQGILIRDKASNNLILDNIIAYNGSTTGEWGIKSQDVDTDSNLYHGNIFHNNFAGAIFQDSVSQELVSAPVIDSITADSTVYGQASPNAYIQIYADSLVPSQGLIFIDTVTADGGGLWNYKLPLQNSWKEILALQDSSNNTSEFSNRFELIYMPPQKPVLISTAPWIADSVVVTWAANLEPDLEFYRVYRSTTTGFTPTDTDSLGSTVAPGTTFVDTFALVAEVTYYYVIAAIDSFLTISAFSNEFSVVFTDPNPLQVKTLSDTGYGSLRRAVTVADTTPGTDTITFNSSLSGGVINVLTTLPPFTTDSTVIIGDTDGDFIPDIQIDGGDTILYGLNPISSYNLISGLCITGFNEGIRISGDNNTIITNYIGLNIVELPDSNRYGITLGNGNKHNWIGDGTVGGRNIISGNYDYGIEGNSTDTNYIVGNYIGLDVSGSGAIANGLGGISLTGSKHVRIGDGTAAGRNIISGNTNQGGISL